MVGIVFVSHSRALAEALVKLVQQVSGPEVPLAIAAGIGPDYADIGTDAMAIMDAIQSVYNADGVVILMDLGSAILSAQTAVEFLEPDQQEHIRFCAAPFVEGAIAAVVQAGLGSDLDTVCREAMTALTPKMEQLGVEIPRLEPTDTDRGAPAVSEPGEEVVLKLQNEHGLHARPAAKFVQLASSFEAEVQVENLTKNRGPVGARSLNAIATLAAGRGDEIRIIARGVQAGQVLDALSDLVRDNFGEVAEAEEPATRVAGSGGDVDRKGGMAAVPVSGGLALGPLLVFEPELPEIPQGPADDQEAAWERLMHAIMNVRREITLRRGEVARNLGEQHAAIFDAHKLILEDPELLKRVKNFVQKEYLNEAAAWERAIQEVAASYRKLDDEYMRQRAADVLDVGTQVIVALLGEGNGTAIRLTSPAVLFAQDLTPTQTAQLDGDYVLGIITVAGGPTSHSAILARTLGVPAVAGADRALENLPDGTVVGLDGFNGTIWVNPGAELRDDLQERRQTWLEERESKRAESHVQGQTRDGRRIEVAANVGNQFDARVAVENGAEAIGLLRTEFLFLTRSTPPNEEDQRAALREIIETMGERPVLVRTLDVGGDKGLPYIDLPKEANPFLGVRAIRLSRQREDLFITQLRSILRAGIPEAVLRIMFPMVANLDEVLWARDKLQQAHRELVSDGMLHRWPVEVGIMVETPAAAVLAPRLAEAVDFFSIGTNDLTQYTLAAERGNPALSALADALHPAVLNLIAQVANAAHAQKKWVGVCGELASETLAVPILVGLGIDELSVNPGAIPEVKSILRGFDYLAARELAQNVLLEADPLKVRAQARSFLGMD